MMSRDQIREIVGHDIDRMFEVMNDMNIMLATRLHPNSTLPKINSTQREFLMRLVVVLCDIADDQQIEISAEHSSDRIARFLAIRRIVRDQALELSKCKHLSEKSRTEFSIMACNFDIDLD